MPTLPPHTVNNPKSSTYANSQMRDRQAGSIFGFVLDCTTMRALTLLNDRITHCTACSRLVSYRETIAAEKRKQYESWTCGGVRSQASEIPVPAFTCSGWRRLLTAATELDEYFRRS